LFCYGYFLLSSPVASAARVTNPETVACCRDTSLHMYVLDWKEADAKALHIGQILMSSRTKP
jgi:hypothetical protein